MYHLHHWNKMNLRSGTVINRGPITPSSSEEGPRRRSPRIEGQQPKTAALQLNEIMASHVAKINEEDNKVKKIQHIFDFYLFLKESSDVILVPKYTKFIQAVVEKTKNHMKTLEEKYFPEMTTTLEKITMFDCYYMLSTVRTIYKKYLAAIDSASQAAVAPAPA